MEAAPVVPPPAEVSMSDTSTPSPRGSNRGGLGSYIPSTASLIKSAWICVEEERERGGEREGEKRKGTRREIGRGRGREGKREREWGGGERERERERERLGSM